MTQQNPSPESGPFRAAPGPRRGPRFPILSPAPGALLRSVILDDCLTWVDVHYYDKRTHLCYRGVAYCEGCERHASCIAKGYLGVMYLRNRARCIAEITEGAYDEHPESYWRPREGFRGMLLVQSRKSGKREGRASACISALPPEERGIILPASFDVREQLVRIFSAPSRIAKPEQPVDLGGEEIPT